MRILAAVLVIVLFILSTPSRLQTVEPLQVPVLLYHNLTPLPASNEATTLPAWEFADQMGWLAANGYTAITTRDLQTWLAAKGDLPPRPVLITFDDGYESNFDLAYPVLKRLGLKATVFVVTSATGKRPGTYPHLTPGELQEMQGSRVMELQAHSHDAHRLVDGAPALVAWPPDEIAADLAALRAAFAEDELNPPTAFAYPFGAYDDELLDALADDGFALGFTVEPGYVRPGDSPLRLGRQIIYPGTPLCRFAGIVEGRPPGGACPR